MTPRRRAEQALVAVICQVYVEGVPTCRVEDLVQAMGIAGISKSQVSRIAGPYKYLSIDASTQRVREGGWAVNVSVVIATVVNAEGRRENAGIDMVSGEDTACWAK